MASNSVEAQRHRERQALRAGSWVALNKSDLPLHLNSLDWLHGTPVTNRHEKRAARAQARRYGCDPGKPEHTERCPKYVKPASAKRAA